MRRCPTEIAGHTPFADDDAWRKSFKIAVYLQITGGAIHQPEPPQWLPAEREATYVYAASILPPIACGRHLYAATDGPAGGGLKRLAQAIVWRRRHRQ